MQGMTTVVAVHETASPAKLCLVALCDEHIVLLHKATWAHIDELVGFSTAMNCEACALMDHPGSRARVVAIDERARRKHLHAVPKLTVQDLAPRFAGVADRGCRNDSEVLNP